MKSFIIICLCIINIVFVLLIINNKEHFFQSEENACSHTCDNEHNFYIGPSSNLESDQNGNYFKIFPFPFKSINGVLVENGRAEGVITPPNTDNCARRGPSIGNVDSWLQRQFITSQDTFRFEYTTYRKLNLLVVKFLPVSFRGCIRMFS